MVSRQPDRLSGAAKFATASLAIFALSLASLLLDPLLRSRDGLPRSARAMVELELSTVAWVPSGRLLRHPGMGHQGVDLRPSPSWRLPGVASERLLFAPGLPPKGQPLQDEPKLELP